MKKKKEYKFPLRLKEELRKPLEKVAEENGRSVNSEINKAIEAHISLIIKEKK